MANRIQIQVPWTTTLHCLKNHRERFVCVLLWKNNNCFSKITAYYVPASLHRPFPVLIPWNLNYLSPFLLSLPLYHLLSPPYSLFPPSCSSLSKRQSDLVLEMSHGLIKTFQVMNCRSVIWTYLKVVWLFLKSEFFLLITAYNSEMSNIFQGATKNPTSQDCDWLSYNWQMINTVTILEIYDCWNLLLGRSKKLPRSAFSFA